MHIRRIVQITDCHLFADPAQALRDIITWSRFIDILKKIRRQKADIDLIVLTGDTAHDEDRRTYDAVRDELADVLDRVRIVPGNHDQRDDLRSVFSVNSDGPDDRVTFQTRWPEWQVIGLDSQRPGELPGSLGRKQLDWLSEKLEASKSIHTLLFLHHPPVAVQSPWLDRIGLSDADDFEQLLRNYPQVRLIGCGHVHQQLAASFGRATVFASPAVGPAFQPRTPELVIDDTPPAYRLWELYPDGRWSTQVLC